MAIPNKKDIIVLTFLNNFMDIEQLYIYFEASNKVTMVRYGIELCGTILT